MCVCVCVCLCVSLDPTTEQVGSAEEEQFEVDQPLYPRNRSRSPSAGERLRMIGPGLQNLGANSRKYPVYSLYRVKCTRPLTFGDFWQEPRASATPCSNA